MEQVYQSPYCLIAMKNVEVNMGVTSLVVPVKITYLDEYCGFFSYLPQIKI